jgi:LacI family transcriptional regulator
MLSSIETELREQGKHVIITAGHSDAEKEMESIEFLISRKCDALILLVYAVDDDYLRTLCEGPLPVVLIGQFIPEVLSHCITIDDEHGGYLAAQCLIEQGHKKLACITGPLWKSDGQNRFAGFKRALKENGLELDPDLIVQGDYQEVSGRQAMETLLAADTPFSGLVCANDEMAAGAIAIARRAGMAIPDDLSVIGFDNVFFTRYMHPALSTIDYPIGKMGQMAARCVLRDVYGKNDFQIQGRFEPTLVRRGSTTRTE